MGSETGFLRDLDGNVVEFTIGAQTSVTFLLTDSDGNALNLTDRFFEARFSKTDGGNPVFVNTLVNVVPETFGQAVLTVEPGQFTEEIAKAHLQLFELVENSPAIEFERIGKFITKVVQEIPRT